MPTAQVLKQFTFNILRLILSTEIQQLFSGHAKIDAKVMLFYEITKRNTWKNT